MKRIWLRLVENTVVYLALFYFVNLDPNFVFKPQITVFNIWLTVSWLIQPLMLKRGFYIKFHESKSLVRQNIENQNRNSGINLNRAMIQQNYQFSDDKINIVAAISLMIINVMLRPLVYGYFLMKKR
ncbi:hypothetical protein [Pediococcus stilesii]|nr:hypothetical protein [Pediococcus stilesii]